MRQGTGAGDAGEVGGQQEPRKSWQMRKRQERAALKEGLAEWQANPYYCAGRVTVPAIIDTLSASFFNRCAPTECCAVSLPLSCHRMAQGGVRACEMLPSGLHRSMLTSLMTELAGDDGRPGGALLRQVSTLPHHRCISALLCLDVHRPF